MGAAENSSNSSNALALFHLGLGKHGTLSRNHSIYLQASRVSGSGRARSGIIVLPCGAGKSLVGVAAAARIRKSCLVLATNAVSVDQWCYQFKLWSTLKDESLSRFTSDSKEHFKSAAGVVVTTFNMIAFGGKRSAESNRIIQEIRNREWGLLLMDEVSYCKVKGYQAHLPPAYFSMGNYGFEVTLCAHLPCSSCE